MPDSPDLAFGAFSDTPPWLLDPAGLGWRKDIESLRASTNARVPSLLRRRAVPPLRRTLMTGLDLGGAILAWHLRERRSAARTEDRSLSRSGISRRLRLAFERLGPTYIKLGQIISSGQGLFPDELVSQFGLLRDQVRAETWETVRTVVEEDLGGPLAGTFATFSHVPIAAASIAQVHAATLRDGTPVVVKVQRPRVSAQVEQDLAAMTWIAPALIGRIPVAALANPPALIELFAQTIVEELDFRLEADNMLAVAEVLARADERSVVVPRPHPSLVTRRVLVMERLEGYGFEEIERMRAAGIETERVIHALLISFLEGAVLHGVFHGDLHAGNLKVLPDGRVALLDYGITGRLDRPRRVAFLKMLMSGTVNNQTGQLEALRDLGALPADTDIPAMIAELGLDRVPEDPASLTPDQILSDVREVTKGLLSYGARFPKVLMLFVKDWLFIDQSLTTMAPDLDIFAEVTSVATYFTQRHGAAIARDIGGGAWQENDFDMDGVRAAIGVGTDTERISYRELQERRRLIQRRMDEHRRRR